MNGWRYERMVHGASVDDVLARAVRWRDLGGITGPVGQESMRYARRRDLSESPIVKTLRLIGCKVVTGTDCDLYVRCPKGLSYLIECKTPGKDAKHRQPIQKQLAEVFGDQYKIALTPVEALQAVGYYEPPTFDGSGERR